MDSICFTDTQHKISYSSTRSAHLHDSYSVFESGQGSAELWKNSYTWRADLAFMDGTWLNSSSLAFLTSSKLW